MIYVAAFRNHDGTIHRERFSADTSDAGTGEIVYPERRVK